MCAMVWVNHNSALLWTAYCTYVLQYFSHCNDFYKRRKKVQKTSLLYNYQFHCTDFHQVQIFWTFNIEYCVRERTKITELRVGSLLRPYLKCRFPYTVLIKLIIIYEQWGRISNTQYCLHLSRNIEIIGTKLFTTFSKTWNLLHGLSSLTAWRVDTNTEFRRP